MHVSAELQRSREPPKQQQQQQKQQQQQQQKRTQQERREMDLNHTTSFISTPHVEPDFPRYYTLIPLVVLTLSGCIVAVVFYVKRKSRLDELRHHLIPLYTYDPTEEQEDWRDYDKEDEEEELAEPLYKDSRLSFASDDGT